MFDQSYKKNYNLRQKSGSFAAGASVMSVVMKIRKVGGSLGVIIPKEELNRMNLKEGDELFGLPEDDGLRLQARDPLFERKMKAFENTRRQFRNALRELAK